MVQRSSIPDTPLTARLRVLWACTCTDGRETWDDWYDRQSRGGTPNGRAIAAVLFDRARLYWPDFYTPADAPAIAVWASLIDTWNPLVTPDVIEQAVDAVHADGVTEPAPCHFIRAGRRILIGDNH